MEQVRTALRALAIKVCRELNGQEIPSRPIWTVVHTPDAPPHVAMDPDRPDISGLRYSLTVGLIRLPEYVAAAEVIEEDPELQTGVIVNELGVLLQPEETNITRAFVTNFLWLFLREGRRLEWDDTRFAETFDELRAEVRRKNVVHHTVLPLSNLKIDIDGIDFGDELRLEPASISELERWINPERSFPVPGVIPPQWDTRNLDRPAVLHARRTVVGEFSQADMSEAPIQMAPFNVGHIISSLRLILTAPISVIFQENETEGMMAFGGRGHSWGPPPPRSGPTAILDSETAVKVAQVWQALQTSPNINILNLPLSRWESSLTRSSLEDSLIDLWIGLEALLLGGAEGELSYRASVRLAEFLGTSGADRKEIYDATRISYTWRSIIVHGLTNRRFTRRNLLQNTVQHTTDRLRSALLKVLDLPNRFDPNNLEPNLLRRE